MQRITKFFSLLLWGAGIVLILFYAQTPALVAAQQPTGSIPTVTGTPVRAYVTVTYSEQMNVRGGPSSYFYPIIGVLMPRQVVPALGRSQGGDWIQIEYPGVPGNVGWVWAQYVSLGPVGVVLPVVEAPPTPTPVTTPTVDPTLEARYLTPVVPTRLPTFTPPGPLVLPTYVSSAEIEQREAGGGVPMGMIILALAMIGAFGSLLSFLRR